MPNLNVGSKKFVIISRSVVILSFPEFGGGSSANQEDFARRVAGHSQNQGESDPSVTDPGTLIIKHGFQRIINLSALRLPGTLQGLLGNVLGNRVWFFRNGRVACL